MRLVPSVLLTALAAVSLAGPAGAQALGTPTPGPVIPDFGAVFDVPSPDLPTPTDLTYRVVFDVSQAADAPDAVNRSIETLARFLNMHARAGVPRERMQLALVVHGAAGKDLLDDTAYQQRFGTANPNLPLLRRLADAGVEVYLCGQTAMSRGLPKEQLAPPVRMALSAMTAHAHLQARGYRPNPF